MEVVVAQPAGQGEPGTHGEGRFAEDRGLPQVVGEVGQEEVVLGRPESPSEAIGSAKDGRRERVKPRYEQVLGVVALVLAVEAAHEPLDAIAAAGQPHLLRPHLGGGGVVERRVERVDADGEADQVSRETAFWCGHYTRYQEGADGQSA